MLAPNGSVSPRKNPKGELKHVNPDRIKRGSGVFKKGVSGFLDAATFRKGRDRQDMRDRLRLAVLTADRNTVLEIINDKEQCPAKELNRLDQNGRSCILNAAFAYQLLICLDFLDAGADVSVQEKESHNTVLHYLAKAPEPSEEALLLTLKTILHGVLAKGANPNLTDISGCSALHYAARAANVSVGYVLIQHGVLLNLRSEQGETALHMSVLSEQPGWTEFAKMLSDQGADPRAPDDAGRSPITILKQRIQKSTEESKDNVEELCKVLETMELVKECDIQDLPDAESLVTMNSATTSDSNVQKRVRKVVAAGGQHLARSASTNNAHLKESATVRLSRSSSETSRELLGPSEEPRQKHGSREPTILDLTLISECEATATINIEYGSLGLRTVDIGARGMYSLYQNVFFGQSHYLFAGRIGSGSKIVAVLRMPNFQIKAYHALVINQFGFFETWIDQALIVGEENLGNASPADLESKLLEHLRSAWSTVATDYRLLDARVERSNSDFAALAVAGDKPGLKGEAMWCSVSSTRTDLPCLILALECRLGLSKRLTCGVILTRSHQTPEQFFSNQTTDRFERLLSILGTRVPLEGWRSYTGGMLPSPGLQSIYYTSWRGFEIVFHVATELTKDFQRQFLGNDKVLIMLGEDGPVQPQFRGNVNSVALVLQCLGPNDAIAYGTEHLNEWSCPAELFGSSAAKNPNAWRLAVYFRKRITNYAPILTTALIRDEALLRDLVIANAVNGHASVMRSPPYSNSVDACFAEETERLVERFLADPAPPKRKNAK